MQAARRETHAHRDTSHRDAAQKSEVWLVLADAGLPLGQGVEWLLDHIDGREELKR